MFMFARRHVARCSPTIVRGSAQKAWTLSKRRAPLWRQLSSESGSSEIAKPGQQIEVDMKIELPESGEVVVDTEGKGDPVAFILGQGQVILALDKFCTGMQVGESWEKVLQPEEAFGVHTPERVLKIPLRPADPRPSMGQIVQLENGVVGKVDEVLEDSAVVDTNHQLAGKEVKMKVSLRKITDLNEEAWSGVKVETIRGGDGETFPAAGDHVKVHYVGELASNGQIFDSSRSRGEPLHFQVGVGRVIQGWDQGLLKMSLGERSRLYIASEFGYGAQGAGPIPPDANLIFDVELLQINDTIMEQEK